MVDELPPQPLISDADFYAEYERMVVETFASSTTIPPRSEWESLGREQTFPFLKETYEKYARAQTWILEQLKQQHSGREIDPLESEHRRLLLRRMADNMAFQMFAGRVEVLASLSRDDQIRGVPLKAAEQAIQEAEEYNKRDPHGFALVSDFTTFIHISDLLYVNNGENPETILIELKSGDTNRKLMEYQKDPENRLACMRRLSLECSRSEIQQLVRMLKQGANAMEAGQKFDSVMENQHEHPVEALDRHDRDSYGDVLENACEGAKEDGGAMGYVDRCLFLGVGYSEDPARAKSTAKVALDRALKLSEADEIRRLGENGPPMKAVPVSIRKEVEERWKITRPVKYCDLLVANLRGMASMPFLNWPIDFTYIMDVAGRRLNIQAGFDLTRFVWLARDYGFDVRMTGRKEAARSQVEKTGQTIWTWGNRAIVIDRKAPWPRFYHWMMSDLTGVVPSLYRNEYCWTVYGDQLGLD